MCCSPMVAGDRWPYPLEHLVAVALPPHVRPSEQRGKRSPSTDCPRGRPPCGCHRRGPAIDLSSCAESHAGRILPSNDFTAIRAPARQRRPIYPGPRADAFPARGPVEKIPGEHDSMYPLVQSHCPFAEPGFCVLAGDLL